MKKLLLSLIFCGLLCLLLAACGSDPAQPGDGKDAPTLIGVWVNEGQYEEGKDFVETLTLQEDGTALIHLDYQGGSYADLKGVWTAEDGHLLVTFPDRSARDRDYVFTLTESTLSLAGSGKDVQYTRKS